MTDKHAPFSDAEYLKWWIENFDTIEKAEKEIEVIKNLPNITETDMLAIYHDIYCLERVIEIHKK